jgi:hypothetical protein
MLSTGASGRASSMLDVRGALMGAALIVVATAAATAAAIDPRDVPADRQRASAASSPTTTFGNGCQGSRRQQWGGYRFVGGGDRLRLVWLDSGSRRPCGVAFERRGLTLFTDDPNAITLDARMWCREIPTDLDPNRDVLIDTASDRAHRAGHVKFSQRFRDLERFGERALRGQRVHGELTRCPVVTFRGEG